MGAYVPILGGIDAFKEGLKAGDPAAIVDPLIGWWPRSGSASWWGSSR